MTLKFSYHRDGSLPTCNGTYIFVFGSNLAGRHGAGAAKVAKSGYGAIYGKGVGHMGNSYAIPTKDESLRVRSITDIAKDIETFVSYSQKTNGDFKYHVTRVGCGLAGFKDSEIAPYFKGCASNCSFPDNWKPYLE